MYYVIDRLKYVNIVLSLRYNFESQVHVAYHFLDRLGNIYNFLDLRNMLHLIFLID